MRYLTKIFIALVVATSCLTGQTQQKSIAAKHFIKEGKIIFRFAPKDKVTFDEVNTKSMRMIRFENNNGVLTNSVVVKELLRSYYDGDTLTWMKLFRKDPNTAGFIYSSLYPGKSKSSNNKDKAKFEKMAYGLMLLSCDLNSDVSKACGLYLADTTINNTKKYTYQLSVYTHSKSEVTTLINSFDVDATQLSKNVLINNLIGKQKKGIASISWDASKYSNEYSGYNLYRSLDGKIFHKRNNSPLILLNTQFEKNKQFIQFKDTLPEINKTYFYHVRGINFFGEESDPSNEIKLYCSPVINSIPIIDTAKAINNRGVRVSWRMADVKENDFPEKYIVCRSNKDKGVYKKISEGDVSSGFYDAEPLASNYYKIGAICNQGQDTIFSSSRLVVIVDTIPPATVQEASATVNKSGEVTLVWVKNKEADLKGYKVFKANRPQDEFVQVNSSYITDTFYVDKVTLKTLTKKVYYKLVASDNNHNSSSFSNLIELNRPDTIAPQAPILKSIKQGKHGILIEVIPSLSDDVVKHELMRLDNSQSDFYSIKTFGLKDSVRTCFDTIIDEGKKYTYKIKATDEDGNSSFSKALDILFETGFRKRITDISYNVDRTSKIIELKWNYDEKDVINFVLYRSKQNEPYTIIKTLEGNTNLFADKNLNINNTYTYKIKAALKDGSESIISLPIKIEY